MRSLVNWPAPPRQLPLPSTVPCFPRFSTSSLETWGCRVRLVAATRFRCALASMLPLGALSTAGSVFHELSRWLSPSSGKTETWEACLLHHHITVIPRQGRGHETRSRKPERQHPYRILVYSKLQLMKLALLICIDPMGKFNNLHPGEMRPFSLERMKQTAR